MRKVVEDRRKENSDLTSELRKTQEALTLANLTIERQRKGGETKAIPSSQKEAQLQKEVDKCMVRARRVSRPCVSPADYESIAEHSQMFNVQAEHALDGVNEVPS